MKLFYVDAEKCTKCSLCAEGCVMGIIDIMPSGLPTTGEGAYRLCINCGYCVDVCVHDAFYHNVRKRIKDTPSILKRDKALQRRRERKQGGN